MNDALIRAELEMLRSAVYYDLTDKAERKRSNADLVELFYDLSVALKIPLFVEAGAREAFASRRIRELLPYARIIAFEANPYNHERFAKRWKFEDLDIEYVHKALTDAAGPVTFNVQVQVAGQEENRFSGRSSLMVRPEEGAVFEEVTVEGARLDDLFRSASGAAIWVDVEGAAEMVLRGGLRVMNEAALVMIEVEDAPMFEGGWLAADVAIFLDAAGLTPIARDFEFGRQHNVIFARKELCAGAIVQRAVIAHLSRIAQIGRNQAQSPA